MALIKDNTSRNNDLVVSKQETIETPSEYLYKDKLFPFGNNGSNEDDRFGEVLSSNDHILVVGSKHHSYDENGSNTLVNSGAIWIYEYNDGWEPSQKKTASNRQSNDYFGESVSLYNNTIVVGSPGNQYDSNETNSISGAGSIYVFDKDVSWGLTQKITPSGLNSRGINDEFGKSVSICGKYLVSGSPNHSYNSSGSGSVSGAGAVWIFKNTTTWNQFQKLVPSGTNNRNPNDNFGKVVLLKNDWLFIQSPNNSYDVNESNFVSGSGCIFVFKYDLNTSTWIQHQKIVSQNRQPNAAFGSSIIMDNNILLVSDSYNNRVEKYELTNDSWIFSGTKNALDTKPETVSLIHFYGDNGSSEFHDETDQDIGPVTNLTLYSSNGSSFNSSIQKNGVGSLNINSGDYAVIQDTDNLQLGTNDFVLEWWQYVNTVTHSSGTILTYGGNNSTDIINAGVGGFFVTLNSSNQLRLNVVNSSGTIFQSTLGNTQMSPSVWYKITLIRRSNIFFVVINNTMEILFDTGIVSINPTNNLTLSSGSNSFGIRFSDLRLTRNNSRYSNGQNNWVDQDYPTIANDPLGSSVLYLFRFESSNSYGNEGSLPVSRSSRSSSISTSIFKYGSSSLEFASHSGYWAFSSVGQTISSTLYCEGYFYPQFTSTDRIVDMFYLIRGISTTVYDLTYDMVNKRFVIQYNGSFNESSIPYDMQQNQWIHIYVEFEISVVKLYVNGVSIGSINTGLSSVPDLVDPRLYIGGSIGGSYDGIPRTYYKGYIDNVRIGTQKRYYETSSIDLDNPSPSGLSDPLWDDVSFLYYMTENIDEKSSSGGATVEFIGNSLITNSEGVYNKQSLEINKDTFQINYSNKFDISQNNFSLEFWYKLDDDMFDTVSPLSVTTRNQCGFVEYNGIFSVKIDGQLSPNQTTRSSRLQVDVVGASGSIFHTVNNNDWIHFCVTRIDSQFILYINGNNAITFVLPDDHIFSTNNILTFGIESSSYNYDNLHCYINDIIINTPSKYTSDFDVPTSSYEIGSQTNTFGKDLKIFNGTIFISDNTTNGGYVSKKNNQLQYKKYYNDKIIDGTGNISILGQNIDVISNIGNTNFNNPQSLFGNNVKLRNGKILISSIGDSYDKDNIRYLDSSGSIYLYENNSGNIRFIEKIVDDYRVQSSNFGYTIDINDNNILVTAPTWMYRHQYSYRRRYTTGSGGNTRYYASNVTEFYIDYAKSCNYTYDSNSVELISRDIGETINSVLSITTDGQLGSYPPFPEEWPEYTGRTTNDNRFGYSSSLISNNYDYVIGSYQNTYSMSGYPNISNVGSVRLYANDTNIDLTSIGSDNYRHLNGNFGFDVSMNGTSIGISEPGDTTNKQGLPLGDGDNYGSVYIYNFDNNENNYLLYDKITSNTPTSGAKFGYNIDYKGSTVISGSVRDSFSHSEIFEDNEGFKFRIGSDTSGYSVNNLGDDTVFFSGNPLYDDSISELNNCGIVNVYGRYGKTIQSVGEYTFDIGQFGNCIMLQDGSYLYTNNSSDLTLGLNDYCVELWIKTTSPTGTLLKTGDIWLGIGTSNNGTTVIDNGRLGVWYNSSKIISTGTNISDGSWHHVALTRSNGVTRLFLDGNIIGTSNNVSNLNTNSEWYIGRNLLSPLYNNFSLTGNLDEIRIYNGIAKYSSNFTVPVSSQGTSEDINFEYASLILLFDNNIFDSSSRWWKASPENKISRNGFVCGRFQNDKFGSSISLENNRVAIGAINHSRNNIGENVYNGSAFIFEYSTEENKWFFTNKLGSTDENYGSSVDLKGSYISILGNNIHDIYFRNGPGDWTNQYRFEPSYNYPATSVMISDSLVVNGYPNSQFNNISPGSFKDITRIGSSWTLSTDKFVPINSNGRLDYNVINYSDYSYNGRKSDSNFGISVDIANNLIVIGSPGDNKTKNFETITNIGSALIYYWDSNKQMYRYQTRVNDQNYTGQSKTVKIRGKTIVSSNLTDSIHFYNVSGMGVTGTTTSINVIQSEDQIGKSIQFYDDTNIISGVPGYMLSGGWVTISKNTIWNIDNYYVVPGINRGREEFDNFGFSLSINQNNVAIGVPGQKFDKNGQEIFANMGSVYTYVLEDGTWVFKDKIISPDPILDGNFGRSVKITSDYIISSQNYSTGSNGNMYVFDNSTSEIITSFSNMNYYTTTPKIGSIFDIIDGKIISGMPTYSGLIKDYYRFVENSGAVQIARIIDNQITISDKPIVQPSIGSNGSEIREGYNKEPMSNQYFGHDLKIYGEKVSIVSKNGYNNPYSDEDNQIDNNGIITIYNIENDGLVYDQTITNHTNISGSFMNKVIFNNKIIYTSKNTDSTNNRYYIYEQDQFGNYQLELEGQSVHDVNNIGSDIGFSNNILILGDNELSGNPSLLDSGGFYSQLYNGYWNDKIEYTIPGIVNSRNQGDLFGYSVNLYQNTLLIGAPHHSYDEDGMSISTNNGAIIEYRLQDYNFTPIKKIVRSNKPDFNFGTSIKQNSNGILVGSSQTFINDGSSPQIPSGGENDYGTVQLFDRNFNIVGQYDGSGINNNYIKSFDMNDVDIFVGAPTLISNDNISVPNSGGMHVVNKTTWDVTTFTKPGESYGRNANDRFGEQIAISDNMIAISSPNYGYYNNQAQTDVGSIFVFNIIDGVPIFDTKLQSNIPLNGNNSLKIIQNKIISDNGQFIVEYIKQGDNWIENSISDIGTHSGMDVISNRLVAGFVTDSLGTGNQPTISNSGSVKTFYYDNEWINDDINRVTIPGTSNGRNMNDRFGYTAKISDNLIVIGTPYHSYSEAGNQRASGTGAVFVYNKEKGFWDLEKKIVSTQNTANNIGKILDISDYYIATGYNDSNVNYLEVFNRIDTGKWQTIGLLNNIDGGFPSNVKLFGNKLLASSPTYDGDINIGEVTNAGSIKQYDINSSIIFDQEIYSPGPQNSRNTNDKFGYTIVSSRDFMVIGAPYHQYDENGNNPLINSGAVWIFSKNNTTKPIKKLTPDDRQQDMLFGKNISIDEDSRIITVGCPLINKVYVYNFDGANTNIDTVIESENLEEFGYSVSVNKNYLAIGAPANNTNGTDSGKVYLYKRTGEWNLIEEFNGFSNNSYYTEDNTDFETTDYNYNFENDRLGSTVFISNKKALFVGSLNHSYDQIGDNYVQNAGAIFVKFLE